MYDAQTAPINVGIFISHSWSYSDHYERLSEWLFIRRWNHRGRPIIFSDYSVPKDNPIHFAQNDRELYSAIYAKIAMSNVVVIPTGMYSSYSKWIDKEVRAAREIRKPILAVDPWGQKRKSSFVLQNSNLTAGWNSESVVSKVWDLFIYG